MKENFIHVCFILDKSGSMWNSVSDVIGGFKSVVDEQKKNTEGTCAVSLYMFDSNVKKMYIGKDISEVAYLDESSYAAMGSTAMNDGIGIAIDEIGEWLNSLPEEERPEKNMIVIMTDGEENDSREYSLERVKDMIKHQEEKYNWTFVYMGTDIRDTTQADSLGIKNASYATRSAHASNYSTINSVVSSYRCCVGDAVLKNATMSACLDSSIKSMNTAFESATGIKVNKDED